jgi:tellurite resistance protein
VSLRFLGVDPAQAVIALRAMKTVALADSRYDADEHALLRAAAKALEVEVDVATLAPTEPDLAGDRIRDPKARERIVQAMILMALMDGEVTPSEVAAVERFAAALRVDEPRVKNLRQLAEGQFALMWADLARRSFARDIFVDSLKRDGFAGLWRIVGPLVGRARDPDLARRYNDLGQLDEGTFGRAYWQFIIDNDLGFPGEPRSVPETGLWHDVTHVLAGYGTQPEEEVLVVSFIAGYKKDDPFFWLFTIALQFHLGIKVSPYSPPMKGLFEPDLVLGALERGAACGVDLSHDWDPWPHFPRKLEDVRAELRIPPRT